MDVQQASSELKTALRELYGPRMHKLYLFGSFARNEQHEFSDVDYLLLLNEQRVQALTEISKMTPLLVSFWDKYHRPFSVIPVSRERFETTKMPLYQNVKAEGIEV
jgi:predicted nucleotidyltransferase